MSEVRRITPIIFVDTIEPYVPFWTEVLGFEIGDSVPGGDGLVFVILKRDGTELMYQTIAGLQEDLPSLVPDVANQTYTLFIEVTGLDEIIGRLDTAGTEVVAPRRNTFYGSDEIFVRAPCGTIVGLAEFAATGENTEGQA